MYYAFSSLLAVALAWVTVIHPGLDRFVIALETVTGAYTQVGSR